MPYNLPPPWDPGYALPDNVVDEGLERRAFVTKWLPRGFYDNPKVGTGGYAVPQYVLDEGYGQGTYTTKWQPSGSYNGPAVPNWLNQRPQVVRTRRLPGGGQVATVQPLGDAALPEPYESYGQKAAQALLSRVAMLPRAKQGQALKAIMDKVDPSLWRRTTDIWNRYRKQGMNPQQALPLALARALSTGLAAEIVATGQRGTAPQAKSLLGLGCYGCMAVLGAFDVSQVTGGPILSGGGGGGGKVAVDPTALPTPDSCYVAPGYTWVYATPDMPGHWERAAVGQPQNPYCPNGPPAEGTTPPIVTITPVVRDKRTMGVQVSPTPDFAFPFMFRSDIPTSTFRDFAGPGDITVFGLSVSDAVVENLAKASNLHVMRDIPAPWLAWMKESITTPAPGRDYSFSYNPQMDAQNAPDVAPDIEYWYGRMGIEPGTKIYTGGPAATIVWPIDNSVLGLYWMMDALNPKKPKSDTNPVVIKFFVSKMPDPSLEAQLDRFFTRIYDAAMDALKDLGQLACGVFGSPAGPAAGAAASTAVGAGPAVGVAGAAIAKNACGIPPPPVVAGSLVPVAIIAGGALLAVALVATRRRKKTSP